MALEEYPLVLLKEAGKRRAEAQKALPNGIDPTARPKVLSIAFSVWG